MTPRVTQSSREAITDGTVKNLPLGEDFLWGIPPKRRVHRGSSPGTAVAVLGSVTEPKSLVWAVFAIFPDGDRHLLIAFAEEKDARYHAEKCTRQPYSEDGRDVLQSASEMLGIKGLSVSPIRVY